MKSISRNSSRGFSLIEIVLALGVVSFALVSMLGLLQVALDSDSSAGRDTTVAAMSGYVLNDLRAVPFDALWAADPQGARDIGPSTAQPAATTYYFTNEGAPVAAADLSKNVEALYKCVVTKTVDELTRSFKPGESTASGLCNQLKLQLEFTWPLAAGGNAQKANSRILYGSIARH